MIKYLLQGLRVMSLLLSSYYGTAQINLCAGIDLSYPEVVTHNNTIINSGQLSDGLHVGIAYRPEDLQFSPALKIAYGRTRLPLQQAGENVAALNFNYLNIMIGENFSLPFHQNELLIYGGIGIACLIEKGVAPSGNQTIVTTIDSMTNISKAFPSLNIGVDYSIITNKSFYLSVGINLNYTLLLSGHNTYDITVTEQGNNIHHYQSSLVGNLVSPGVSVAMHHKLHKRKSMYL